MGGGGRKDLSCSTNNSNMTNCTHGRFSGVPQRKRKEKKTVSLDIERNKNYCQGQWSYFHPRLHLRYMNEVERTSQPRSHDLVDHRVKSHLCSFVRTGRVACSHQLKLTSCIFLHRLPWLGKTKGMGKQKAQFKCGTRIFFTFHQSISFRSQEEDMSLCPPHFTPVF